MLIFQYDFEKIFPADGLNCWPSFYFFFNILRVTTASSNVGLFGLFFDRFPFVVYYTRYYYCWCYCHVLKFHVT